MLHATDLSALSIDAVSLATFFRKYPHLDPRNRNDSDDTAQEVTPR